MMKSAPEKKQPFDANDASPQRTVAYIEELVREMETLALNDGLTRLGEILRSAREEARRLLFDNSKP